VARDTIVMKDRVAATSVRRVWAVPGLLDKQSVALDLGAAVLGGLASSRLDEALVRDEKLAVNASASYEPFHRIGLFRVQATVRPGVDVGLVERRLDALMADLIAKGPTAAELRRASTTEVAGRIRGLEQVGGFGGKAVALAEGKLYAGDANFYRTQLSQYAAATPAQVRAAMAQWLGPSPLKIRLEPGQRPDYEEAKGGAAAKDVGTPPPPTRREVPPVGQSVALDFPTVERTTLSNGIKVGAQPPRRGRRQADGAADRRTIGGIGSSDQRRWRARPLNCEPDGLVGQFRAFARPSGNGCRAADLRSS
jgi:hypothetical protein